MLNSVPKSLRTDLGSKKGLTCRHCLNSKRETDRGKERGCIYELTVVGMTILSDKGSEVDEVFLRTVLDRDRLVPFIPVTKGT